MANVLAITDAVKSLADVEARFNLHHPEDATFSRNGKKIYLPSPTLNDRH
jgi:hypothetical protein